LRKFTETLARCNRNRQARILACTKQLSRGRVQRRAQSGRVQCGRVRCGRALFVRAQSARAQSARAQSARVQSARAQYSPRNPRNENWNVTVTRIAPEQNLNDKKEEGPIQQAGGAVSTKLLRRVTCELFCRRNCRPAELGTQTKGNRTTRLSKMIVLSANSSPVPEVACEVIGAGFSMCCQAKHHGTRTATA
jgi:hypothetical protein